MTMLDTTISISLLIALVGCFVGLAGYLSSHDKKLSKDSEWKGEVKANLQTIITMQTTQNATIDRLQEDTRKNSVDIGILVNDVKTLKEVYSRLEGPNTKQMKEG